MYKYVEEVNKKDAKEKRNLIIYSICVCTLIIVAKLMGF